MCIFAGCAKKWRTTLRIRSASRPYAAWAIAFLDNILGASTRHCPYMTYSTMTEILLGATIIIIVALLFYISRMREQDASQVQAATALTARNAELQRERDALDEKLTAFTRATSDGIVQVDANGIVVYMNDIARSLLDVTNGLERPLREVA